MLQRGTVRGADVDGQQLRDRCSSGEETRARFVGQTLALLRFRASGPEDALRAVAEAGDEREEEVPSAFYPRFLLLPRVP